MKKNIIVLPKHNITELNDNNNVITMGFFFVENCLSSESEWVFVEGIDNIKPVRTLSRKKKLTFEYRGIGALH